MRRAAATGVLALALLTAATVSAEELTLSAALRYAHGHAPSLASVRHRVSTAGIQKREALSRLFPSLVFMAYTQHDDYVLENQLDGGSTSEQGQQLRLDFAPEGFVGSYFDYRGAGAMLQLNEAEVEAERARVSLEVIRAFYALEDAEQDRQRFERLAAVMAEAGDRAGRIEATLQLLDAEEAQRAAQVRLAAVLGHPQADMLAAGAVDLPLPTVTAAAPRLSPGGMSRARIDMARAMVRAARAEYLPEPFLRVDFSLSGDPPRRDPLEITRTSGSYFVLAGLRLDLLGLYQARLHRQEAGLRLRLAKDLAREDVRSRSVRADAIRQRLADLDRRRELLQELATTRDAELSASNQETYIDQARLESRRRRLESEAAVLRWELAIIGGRLPDPNRSDAP